MRLIDADKLQKDTEWNEQVDGFTSYSSAEISNAETVYAIPITWINTWLNTGRNAKYFIHMMELIEEWKKENEANAER